MAAAHALGMRRQHPPRLASRMPCVPVISIYPGAWIMRAYHTVYGGIPVHSEGIL
eukprot:COSAG02_NODE_30926_length_542_cov_1.390519_1_plen_54_part_10